MWGETTSAMLSCIMKGDDEGGWDEGRKWQEVTLQGQRGSRASSMWGETASAIGPRAQDGARRGRTTPTCMRLVTHAIMLSATILLRPSSSFLSLQQYSVDTCGMDLEGVDQGKADLKGMATRCALLASFTPVQSCQPLDAGQPVVLQAQLLQLSAGLEALYMADLVITRGSRGGGGGENIRIHV